MMIPDGWFTSWPDVSPGGKKVATSRCINQSSSASKCWRLIKSWQSAKQTFCQVILVLRLFCLPQWFNADLLDGPLILIADKHCTALPLSFNLCACLGMEKATMVQAAFKSLGKVTLSHSHNHHHHRRRYHRSNHVASFPAGATVSAHKQIVMLRLGNPLGSRQTEPKWRPLANYVHAILSKINLVSSIQLK